MMTLKKPAPCSGRVYQVLIKKNDGHLRAAADASVRKGAHVAPSCAHRVDRRWSETLTA